MISRTVDEQTSLEPPPPAPPARGLVGVEEPSGAPAQPPPGPPAPPAGEVGGDAQLPSEAAQLIARLIPELPARTVGDLHRLIAHRLTAFDASRARYARLGLLVDIVSTGTGEIPTTRAYEAQRVLRVAAGEIWPAPSTLSVAYGGWLRAVRGAMLLARDGTDQTHVSHSNHHTGWRRAYTHAETVAALLRCHDDLGTWPTEGEYMEWRHLTREIRRNAGLPEPRNPSREVWHKLFGTWEAWTGAARRAQRERQEAERAPTEA